MSGATKVVCRVSGGVVVPSSSQVKPAKADIHNPPKPRVPLHCGQYKLGVLRREFSETADAFNGLNIHDNDFDSLATSLVRRFDEHKTALEAILSIGADGPKGGNGS